MSEPRTILDHNKLFDSEKYVRQRERKREFENACPEEEVLQTAAYTRSQEYADKNFARQAVVVNPAKACQPLGAVMAALGFEKTLPFIHGSQGCTAYFRSHFARHFKEPVPAVSSSMTEDGAVFGGMRNLIDGLETSVALYKPEMIAMSTTCMAEVIGDDLSAFIGNARKEGVLPEGMPIPFANTPSFSGSHITGYDNMLKAILSYLYERSSGQAVDPASSGKLNVLLGFEPYTGNFSELRRILGCLGRTAPCWAITAAISIPERTELMRIITAGPGWPTCRPRRMRRERWRCKNTACAKRRNISGKLGDSRLSRCTRRWASRPPTGCWKRSAN